MCFPYPMNGIALWHLRLIELDMPKSIDLTGLKFGRITVLTKAPNQGKRTFWLCICECGKTRPFSTALLRRGESNSCGCTSSDATIQRNLKHGLSKTKEHRIWCGIKTRCFNSRHHSFEAYGGRGITMSDEWRDSFSTFLEDMGPMPSPQHTIERVNAKGPYAKGNCVWATYEQQGLNRTNTMRMTLGGRTLTLVEWSKITNLSQQTLRERRYANWSDEEALTTPTRATRNAKRVWPKNRKNNQPT